MRMVVVFPLPLGPIKPKTLPSGTVRERSSTAVASPKVLVTLEISTAGIGMGGAVFQSGICQRLVHGVWSVPPCRANPLQSRHAAAIHPRIRQRRIRIHAVERGSGGPGRRDFRSPSRHGHIVRQLLASPVRLCTSLRPIDRGRAGSYAELLLAP